MTLIISWKGDYSQKAKTEIPKVANEALNHRSGSAADKDFIEVLIRSVPHDTTIDKSGNRVSDPLGFHITMDFKTQTQKDNHKHITAHVYLTDKTSFVLKEIVWFPEWND